eukprot:TRINITY_DN119_c0_g1_i1.p1 TRINITY_DN119_c0_g1~~TRINITY_DN119_c0_g1_i1.p1  ORF type:complete len:626 (-),score=337.06 TRINITY_DN119_c0_g1_i1:121-1971(-)
MWKWSRIGFGTQRLVDPAQAAILRHALRHANINVIDTAPGFGRASAEEIVGETLAKVEIPREELCLISRFGKISPFVYEEYQEDIMPGLHIPEDQAPYSFHPDVIEKELHGSLKRLNTPYIDYYLMTSPDILSLIGQDGSGNHSTHDVTKAISIAFELLEKKVEQGYIKGYGISSDALALPKFHPMRLNYEKLLPLAHAAAKAVGKDGLNHSFKAVQFGANIVETDGIDGVGKWAINNGIFSIASRPLSVNASIANDAIENHRLALRLEPTKYLSLYRNVKELFKEEKYKDFRRFSREIDSLVKYGEFKSSNEWRDTIEGELLERISDMAEKHTGEDQAFNILEELLQEAENEVSYRAAPSTLKMLKTEGVYDPQTSEARSLEEHALSAMYSESNLSCILVGMTNIDHLKTVFSVLEEAPELVEKGVRPKKDLRQSYSDLAVQRAEQADVQADDAKSETESEFSDETGNEEEPTSVEAIEKKHEKEEKQKEQNAQKEAGYLKQLEKTPEGLELMRLARVAVVKKSEGKIPTEEEEAARKKLFDLYVQEKKKKEEAEAKKLAETPAATTTTTTTATTAAPKKASKKSAEGQDVAQMLEKLSPEQREKLAGLIKKTPQ